MVLNGAVTIAVVLSLAFAAAALWYTIRALQRLEALPKRRMPERVVYEADWNRILIMTQLKKPYDAQPEKGADISE